MSRRAIVAAWCLVAVAAACPAQDIGSSSIIRIPGPARTYKPGDFVSLIPRALLFGNPERVSPKISPDGKRLAWLEPVNGVLNVWACTIADPKDVGPITADSSRGIRQFLWAYDNAHVVYLQDKGGDENWRAYSVDVATRASKDLTPLDRVQARIEKASPRRPGEMVLALNDRDAQFHDLYRVDLATGERTLLQQNPGRLGRGVIAGFMIDDDFRVRIAERSNEDDGSKSLLVPDGEGWKEFQNIPAADALATEPLEFGPEGRTLYMSDSRGRDTAALTEIDATTGDLRAIHAWSDLADVSEALIHPTTKLVQAVAFEHDKRWWLDLDGSELDIERAADGHSDRARVVSRSLDDRQWIVAVAADNGPTRYVRFDRTAKKAIPVFTDRPALDLEPLAPMQTVTIKARDGLKLVSYLTLPLNSHEPRKQRPTQPVPLVLLVHGGPWARDSWGLNPIHQLLANRGYAVLSVNFRGSTGFGKEFGNAGNREWAARMHDDLLDAVKWAIDEKIADPAKVAIMGGSYGGYATLVGLTFSPETFACGVDIVGPSNLVTLLDTLPPYWAPMVQMFRDRVGDNTTEAGKAFLWDRSPLSRVDKISRPLLIGQGANDPRVKQKESDQIVKAMQEKGLPVTYVLFPDEGHGFRRPPNSLAFYAVTEQFLAKHLGGRAEPIGTALEGSTITVPSGVENIPGLSESLRK